MFGFLIPFILPLVGGSVIAAEIVIAVGTLALSFGLSYVANKFLTRPGDEQQPQAAGGTQLDVRVDANVPRSVLFGRAVTAGSLVHAQTFGLLPGTSTYATVHNNEMIEIFALADHPVTAFVETFVEGQPITLEAEVAERGFPITEYEAPNQPGSFNLAIKFFNGTQVAADQFSVDRIGDHPDLPWTTNHIGVGIAYARAHYVGNPQRVPGRFRWKFVVDGIKLYDPRLDTTAGGSGAHRFDDISTHEWTDNPAVIAYNILRGIYVLDGASNRDFLYGVEGTTADQLPYAIWAAAMDDCDTLVDINDGGSPPGQEKRYRCGGEITVDTPPVDTLKEILKATGGRLVEIGGIYKLYVSTPSAGPDSFTDGDIVATEDDSFRPVLGLENRINYITGTYTEPEEDWVPKVAPPRANASWETEDGRRLPADLDAPMVQSRHQMQRLMQQMLMRSRQQRKHQLTLGRPFFHIEPGDVVTWDSDRNGYTAKLFEVDAVDYMPNLNIRVALTEVDPADYDWTPATDTMTQVIAPPVSTLPTAKVITDFAAAPFVHTGTTGVERPAIKLTWTDPQDGDVTAVLWQLRVAADPTNTTSGRHEEVADQQTIILNGLAQDTAYEVRARFESFEGYQADWSLWIAVTTPSINELTEDFINDLLDIERARVENLAQLVGEHGQLILQQNDVLLGVQSGLDETNAEGTFRIIAVTAPDDALAAVEMEVRASAGAAWAEAAIQLLAYANVDGTARSRIRLIADSTQIGQPGEDGGDFVNLFEIGTHNEEPAIIARAEIFRDDGIDSKMMKVGAANTVATLADADQTREQNAWNNGGNGEEFGTVVAALAGDGLVAVECRLAILTGVNNHNSAGHWMSIEANGVEIYRQDLFETIRYSRFPIILKIETEALAAGTNTIVGKLFINDTATGANNQVTVEQIFWNITEYHKPAVQAGGAVAATLAYQTTVSSVAPSNPHTFSSTAIGTASSIRRVVLGVGYRATTNILGITIGGIDAERLISRVPSGTPIHAELWVATVPTGTTADITVSVTPETLIEDLAVSVWAITSSAEAVVDAHAAGSAAGSSPIALNDLEIQTGGVAIAFAWARFRDTFAITWTGTDSPTENAEATVGDCHYAAYSFLTTESTTDDDISFSHVLVTSPSFDCAAIVAASWR